MRKKQNIGFTLLDIAVMHIRSIALLSWLGGLDNYGKETRDRGDRTICFFDGHWGQRHRAKVFSETKLGNLAGRGYNALH